MWAFTYLLLSSSQFMPNVENRSSKPADNKVIICGAGIAGLTLAWWLDRAGWEVLVLEVAPELRDEGYPIDLMGSGPDVVERMGIRSQLEAAQYSISKFENANKRDEQESLLEGPDWWDDDILTLMRPELVRTLHAALSDDIEIRYELTVDVIQQNRSSVTVCLSDGTTERASFLVGADGIHSRVRELTFGDEHQFLRPLGYHTAAFIFENESMCQQLSRTYNHFNAPNKIVACLPLQDGRLATYFIYRTPTQEQPDDICTTLRRIYREFEGAVPVVLDHCEDTDNIYHDHVSQVEVPRWTNGRVTLLGDSCQAVSLIAGRGASLAMGSAYVLAYELRQNGPVEEAFAKYESHMRPKIENVQTTTRKNVKWLVPPSQQFRTLQKLMFQVTQYPGGGLVDKLLFRQGTESVIEGL